MRILDLYCCAGGAAAGYKAAGFEVVGVDINPQPRYSGDVFYQGDALEFLANHVREFDAIHASPPCQAYTTLKALSKNVHPDLVAPTRHLLRASGKPWIMENVPRSPLIDPIVLCGTMFDLGALCRDGEYRQLRRHRLFESNITLTPPGKCNHIGQALGVYGVGGGGQQTRGYKGYADECRTAMGIDWMTQAGLSQAIPPAYTEWLGGLLASHLG